MAGAAPPPGTSEMTQRVVLRLSVCVCVCVCVRVTTPCRGVVLACVCVWGLVQCTPLFVPAGRSLWGEAGAGRGRVHCLGRLCAVCSARRPCRPLLLGEAGTGRGRVHCVGVCVCVCVCVSLSSVRGCTPLWPRWSEGAPGIQRRRFLPCPVRGGDGVAQDTSVCVFRAQVGLYRAHVGARMGLSRLRVRYCCGSASAGPTCILPLAEGPSALPLVAI